MGSTPILPISFLPPIRPLLRVTPSSVYKTQADDRKESLWSQAVKGERLLVARKKAGLSLRALADKAGNVVTPQAIGKYERNEMAASPSVVAALAGALDVDAAFLNADSGVRLGQIDFRKLSRTTAQDRAVVEAAVIEHVERYLHIERLLELGSAVWQPPYQRCLVATMDETEEAAERLRDAWRLGEDPIPDLTHLLEEKGLKVLVLHLPDTVSGLTCLVHGRNADAVPVIVVNRRHGLERRRMTLAHELAHRCMSSNETIDEEKAATRFASAFLMPASHVRREVGKHRSALGVDELMETKRLYRVSAAALLVRFRDLGIIRQETLAYVFQTVGRRWRSEEPDPIRGGSQAELPTRFRRLCHRAVSEGLLPKSVAAEYLSQNAEALTA
ncbi:MAG: XRE family transcriptional regulator [Magnetospirillum sp.]|nr:XRE family transcriptional regulator [Magnetospirillum sp.]